MHLHHPRDPRLRR
uniref:Uncharacterized protein n=1 Tax=Arundo donax TaxID=35708 RepID=A0A0A9HV14_ARUDO